MKNHQTPQIEELLNSSKFQRKIGTSRFWSHARPDDSPVVHPLPSINDSKPWGSVWWGVGASWISWVHAEMPRWIPDRFSVVSALYINDDRILSIQNDQQLQVFSEKYADGSLLSSDNVISRIQWDLLKKRGFSGIEIPTYLSSSRLKMSSFWYYGWDCASGAVWDQTAILGHKPLFMYREETDTWYPL